MLSRNIGANWIVMMAVAIPASVALHKPVQTASGALQGIPGNDPSVTVFRGVPYAAPPIGNLWESSQPNSFQNIDNKCYHTSRKKIGPER